ncbi:MAG: carbon-nitrogen hydrolase family protein [Bryobacteraceae bacterium]
MVLRTIGTVSILLLAMQIPAPSQSTPAPGARKMKVCAAQSGPDWVSWHLNAAGALQAADRVIEQLVPLVNRAGTAGCDVLTLPEDTLGVLHWEVANKPAMKDVLIPAVKHMLDRLGRTAAGHHMYLVLSSDTAEPDNTYRNTAFFLGRDGREIGRYYKVHPTITESDRVRGETFPVFETPDLGGVGMLICYDMVMPESSRGLALNGADLIFVSTMGGAVTTGDESLNRAAFRVRAADNFVYLVVAMRNGALIVSPQGAVLSEVTEPGSIAMAEIDPFGGREGGDALNSQRDMRARLFRERNPAAYGVFTNPNPPALKKIPATISVNDAVRIGSTALTIGEQRFAEAEALARSGKSSEAAQAFARLRADFPGTWIEREAESRLSKIKP